MKAAVSSSQQAESDSVRVFLSQTSQVSDESLKDYLIGAVAGEMPASYHEEALKAQAVACCSYLNWLKKNADNPDYDITNDSSRHQSYLTKEQMKEKWGDKFDSCYEKIASAVSSVYGEALYYKNEPALTVFHAISPGSTHNSRDVWQEDIPYLVSVSAPGDTLSPDIDSQRVFTQQELSALLGQEEGQELLGEIKVCDTGYVTEICLGEKRLSGTEAASLLSLRSPTFTAEYINQKYIFTVRGYGHGLGMSQYSADYMARQGSSYEEILTHFYKGCKIKRTA